VYMLGLMLGLFSALLDMFRTRSPMFDRLQRRNLIEIKKKLFFLFFLPSVTDNPEG